jgi:hypothetical protein
VQCEHFIHSILDDICGAKVRIWVRHGCLEWTWIHEFTTFNTSLTGSSEYLVSLWKAGCGKRNGYELFLFKRHREYYSHV